MQYLCLESYDSNKGSIDFSCLRNLKFLELDLASDFVYGVEELPELISLVQNNAVVDIERLLPLRKKLRYLNLNNSTVLNIEMLAEFRNLEVLYIQNIRNVAFRNPNNLSFIRKLRKLKVLSVQHNTINSLSMLNRHRHLEKLYIGHTNIKDIPPSLSNNDRLEIFR